MENIKNEESERKAELLNWHGIHPPTHQREEEIRNMGLQEVEEQFTESLMPILLFPSSIQSPKRHGGRQKSCDIRILEMGRRR